VNEPDAVALARLVASGECSPRQLAEDAIARINSREPSINAISWTRFDEALTEADGLRPTGPFAGVPILLKDHRCVAADHETRFGTKQLKDVPRPWGQDSNVYRAIRDAGFIVLGRTTTPEFATALLTESEACGTTRNPVNVLYTPGGSSGGSAAAVASGMVPVAHATDGGGSIRIPASACGLIGLKSSRGRISMGPDTHESWAGSTTEGMISRTVRDTAATFDVMARFFRGDPYCAPPLRNTAVEALKLRTPPLRIGVMKQRPETGEVLPSGEVEAVLEAAAERLGQFGHTVVCNTPEALHSKDFADDFLLLIAADVEILARKVEAQAGLSRNTLELEERNIALRERAMTTNSADYLSARYRLGRWSSQLAQWWNDFDVLLTPTLGDLPAKADACGSGLTLTERGNGMTPFTSYFNVGGQPAISLPLGISGEGLPIGIQCVAEYGHEDVLIQLARDFENEGPWHVTDTDNAR
jgi:amidase